MQFKRAGTAVSEPRAPYLIMMCPWRRERSWVLTHNDIIHEKIRQDLEDDLLVLLPDIEVMDANADLFPDRQLAEMDTQSVEKPSDVTMVDENATKPIWMWEYST